MSKQKVRPMVDKELRDEVVGYLCGSGSFNQALGWYIKGNKQLIAQNKKQAELLDIFKEEIEELKAVNRISSPETEAELMFTKLELQANKSQVLELMNKNTELSVTLNEAIKQRNGWVNKWNEARNDLLRDGKIRKVDAFGFVAAGVAIGAAVMTFLFNVM